MSEMSEECDPTEMTTSHSSVRESIFDNNMLPEKSWQRYDTAYTNFIEWKEKNNATSFSESVLLAYFEDISNKYKSSTLWSIYSMLKTTIIAKEDINIATYLKLRAFLRRKAHGYIAKKSNTLSSEDIKKFIDTAPNKKYLLTKVALAFGICGALRRTELCNIKLQDLTDLNSALLVKIPITSNKTSRNFTITGLFYEIYKLYANLRPKNLSDKNLRFFVNYQKGKCTSQFVGINKFGSMVKEIAYFLKLPNVETYTGHSFRRSSATILVDSGGDLLTLKQHGGWASTIAEGYINNSVIKRIEISNRIAQSVEAASTSSSSYITEDASHPEPIEDPLKDLEAVAIKNEEQLTEEHTDNSKINNLAKESEDDLFTICHNDLPKQKGQTSEGDEFDIFGRYVASEMRTLSYEHLRKKMKRKFQQIILDINDEEEELNKAARSDPQSVTSNLLKNSEQYIEQQQTHPSYDLEIKTEINYLDC